MHIFFGPKWLMSSCHQFIKAASVTDGTKYYQKMSDNDKIIQ